MKLQITHRDIISMVSEVVNRLGNRRLLSEITAADAYARFYDGKIEPEIYQMLMSGTTNMTPFHKAALDLFTDENLRSYRMDRKKYAAMIGNLWSNMSQEGRQFLVKSCANDPELCESFSQFSRLVKYAANMKSFSEKQYSDRGFEVLFQKDNLYITCTKSYSSSCHFYGKSHWCTASDMFGRYDGFEMFKDYTTQNWDGKGILVQFFNGGPDSYQMQYLVAPNGIVREGQCCNWEDSTADTENIDNMLKKYGVTYSEIFKNYISPNALRLAKETEEIGEEETIYYNRKRAERLQKIFKGIDNGTVSKTADEFAKTAALESQNSVFQDEGGLYTCWIKKTNAGFIEVSLRYNGANESEKNIMQMYYEDDADMFTGRYGRVPDNFMFYVFKPDGTLYKKWRGEVSTTVGSLIFVTNGYNDDLVDVNIAAIINSKTYEEILAKPYSHISISDCEWILDKNIEKFVDAYNEEKDEMVDEDDIGRGDWFLCIPTRDDYRSDRYLAINYYTLEEVYFQT